MVRKFSDTAKREFFVGFVAGSCTFGTVAAVLLLVLIF